jgi:anti-sigma regulatory factor (Ser/Thr protein kinase)
MVSMWLADQRLAHLDEGAMVTVSEHVTNAVVHGGETISLTCSRSNGTFRIEVFDSNPFMSLPDARPDAETGSRGLPLIAVLSNRWGCGAVPGGKVVWAETVTSQSQYPESGASESRIGSHVL